MDLFASSIDGETHNQPSPPVGASLNHHGFKIALSKGPGSTFRNVVFCSPQNTGRWAKSEDPVLPCVMHNLQDNLESMFSIFRFEIRTKWT
jgi:hypothetical protein